MTLTHPTGWRHEGSPDITVFCHGRCQCRVIPHDYTGRCLWCDAQLRAPQHKRTRPQPAPEPQASQVWDADAIARWRQEIGL